MLPLAAGEVAGGTEEVTRHVQSRQVGGEWGGGNVGGWGAASYLGLPPAADILDCRTAGEVGWVEHVREGGGDAGQGLGVYKHRHTHTVT